MINIKTNIATRFVLFEKFNEQFLRRIQLQEEIYKSVIKSQKNNSPNSKFIKCITLIINDVLKLKKYTINLYGNYYHVAFEFCIEGLKKYENDGDSKKCFKYFIYLIKRAMYAKF